ncbi:MULTISPECIES: hypothetical protein [Caballeronia]|jgi:hypothetical protein|uniref:Uncharacterized protein n=1 Tax=Caballeronia concitans TaxID=1777133 RepID=A0A658R5H6_9BURK|nr:MULTISPECIES: hypothetical protein [Caballeronia]SAL52523.1 hypothetical protein AWB72_05603 [Caballeronia concitans]
MATTLGKLSLRDRLDWLLLAIHSGRYGQAVNTINPELIEHYIAATRMPGAYRYGRLRARHLADDLVELRERGLLARRSARNVEGGASFYFSYSLTGAGAAEAYAIKTRDGRE